MESPKDVGYLRMRAELAEQAWMEAERARIAAERAQVAFDDAQAIWKKAKYATDKRPDEELMVQAHMTRSSAREAHTRAWIESEGIEPSESARIQARAAERVRPPCQH